MSDFFATQDDYDRLVGKVGAVKAAQIAREQGWSIQPNEAKFTPVKGGDMEDEDQNVAFEDAADNAAADDDAANAYGRLGGLSAMNLTKPEDVSRAIMENARSQQRYYDSLAEQIKQRRYGPTEAEKLFALSNAFFSPTKIRGFAGTMGNVLPVLQSFERSRREEEQSRNEAMNALAKQRLELSQGNVKTALDLQRLMATYAKAGKPQFALGSDNAWHVRPGTGDAPPMPEMDAYGNYVITDARQLTYLPVNTKVVEPGQDPTKPRYVTKPKYVSARS